jgi:hypothetical protein
MLSTDALRSIVTWIPPPDTPSVDVCVYDSGPTSWGTSASSELSLGGTTVCVGSDTGTGCTGHGVESKVATGMGERRGGAGSGCGVYTLTAGDGEDGTQVLVGDTGVLLREGMVIVMEPTFS